jgi:hypothetical protein
VVIGVHSRLEVSEPILKVFIWGHVSHYKIFLISPPELLCFKVGIQPNVEMRHLLPEINVRNDAAHLGMATFCQAFVTADKRLSKRAKAVYSFLGIPAEVIFYSETP